MKTTLVLVVVALLVSMMLAVLASIRAPMDVHQFQVAFPGSTLIR